MSLDPLTEQDVTAGALRESSEHPWSTDATRARLRPSGAFWVAAARRPPYALGVNAANVDAGERAVSMGRPNDAYGSAPERCRGARLCAAFLALLCVSLLGIFAVSPVSGASKKEKSHVGRLARSLRLAMQARDDQEALKVVEKLVEISSTESFEALLRYAFLGTSAAVEAETMRRLQQITDPKILNLVRLQATKHRNYRARIALLSLAAEGTDHVAALDVLHPALSDPSPSVVFYALLRLRQLRRAESVEPLVELLERLEPKERRDRRYHDLVSTLKEITGRSYKGAAAWRRYVRDFKADLDSGKLPPRQEKRRRRGRTSVGPSFFSVPINSDRVLFVIDVSHSMLKRDEELSPDTDPKPRTSVDRRKKNQPKPEELPPSRARINRVKNELISLIRGLPERVSFGVVSFSHEIGVWGGVSNLQPATTEAKAAAVAWVAGLNAIGATRTDAALARAFEFREADTVYLLTDGRPQDEENRPISVDGIVRMVDSLNRYRRCRIHTISFEQVRSRAMRQFVLTLAERNDGKCTFLP